MAIQGWRWAKTIFTWIVLLGTAGVHFGKALLATVDQASNLYAIGEHLEKARKMGTGTVNIGSLLLFLFGAAGATVITLWIWRRGPFRALAAAPPVAVPNEPALTEGAPPADRKSIQIGMIPVVSDWKPHQPLALPQSDIGVLLKSPVGHFQVNGIGIIRGVWIEFLRQPVEHWDCTCAVDFHELGASAEASPLQLMLTGQDGQPELATLTTEALPRGAGKVIYTGTARTPEMQLCVQRTMNNLSAAQTIPPPPDTYCYVEVHVAPGQRMIHQKTTIRLDYELLKLPARGFFVPIIYKPLKSAVNTLAAFQVGLLQALK